MLKTTDPHPIRIDAVRFAAAADGRERLSANVDGSEIWFMADPGVLAPRAEYFLAMAMFHALASGRPVVFDDALPLSPALAAQLGAISRLLCQWNPEFHPVRVTARLEEPASRPFVAGSFSGGVDSSFTYLCNRSHITHLLTLSCFDRHEALPQEDRSQPWPERIGKIRRLAAIEGKQLLAIESNADQWCEAHWLSFDYVHGSLLCSVAVGLGLEAYYIPTSSAGGQLAPWGSHPLLDPLFSTQQTEVIHHGYDHRRTQKIEAIATDQVLLDHLQVCWHSQDMNCGRCSKCVRTMLALDLLGVEGAPFPKTDPLHNHQHFRAKTDLGASFIWDIRLLAQRVGRADVIALTSAKIREYQFRKHGSALAKAVLGAHGRRLLQRLGYARPTRWRAVIRHPDNFE